MKIAIDVRCLMAGRRTGVEEYTLNLLFNLFRIDKKNEYILFYNSAKEPVFDFSVFDQFSNVKIKRLRIPNKLLNLSFWYLGWPHIDQIVGGVEIIFLPNINFFGKSSKAKLILTIHDLSFERYPEHFSWKRRLWHIFINPKKICQAADHILAVSDSTKDDLKNLYKINDKKITFIHSAVSDKFCPISRNDEHLIKVKEKYRLPYKFILYLGTIEPRKNITGIVRAFNKLQKEGSEEIRKYKLVIAGSSGWKQKKVLEEIDRSPFREKIQIINFVPDEDKKYVYNLASLFIYPSNFEGFGFPPLEAMRCGVPVISSNNSAIPEILQDAAILIDPNKPDEMKRAVKELISDSRLREKLIKTGLLRAAGFKWEETASSFLDTVVKMV